MVGSQSGWHPEKLEISEEFLAINFSFTENLGQSTSGDGAGVGRYLRPAAVGMLPAEMTASLFVG